MSSVACQEAMELYSEQMKLQAERKPVPKQDSKAYTKIKVTDIMYTCIYKYTYVSNIKTFMYDIIVGQLVCIYT